MFLDNLKILMEKRDLNNFTLSKQSGIPYTTIDGLFRRNEANVKLTTVLKLCDFFNVSVDFLVRGSNPEYADKAVYDDEKEVLEKYKGLTDIEREKILTYISDLAELRNYKNTMLY